ncbi:hypothetical protein UlMin_014868 [Ulmus minor]
MMTMWEIWIQIGSLVGSFILAYPVIERYLPSQFLGHFGRYTTKVLNLVSPYITITFREYTGDRFKRSEAYLSIQSYLSANSSTRAKRLKAHDIKDSKSIVLSLDDNEEVTDEFKGVKLWWTSRNVPPRNGSLSFYPSSDERRLYQLTFHRRHRDLITESYVNHVVKEGKEIAVRNRQRKLYTNGTTETWYGEKRTKWTHVQFEHPATFDTLAMNPKKKKEIVNDLVKFSKGKEYYTKIGKPWKRGYLLFGPPGTGKSTMIAAMSNFLDFDIYDLELTAVRDNTDLKKLLIDTSNKSIIVIEDIDCSLDLTGQRKKEKEKEKDEDEKKDPHKKDQEEEKSSKVTLSGLLNSIDGIWSACGGERLIVFTTNYVDKLDPALIRRGRMDKHVEMSYCCFETFKALAKNYLDVEYHDLFPTIECLLEETNTTPADVAEDLMPKSDTEDADTCLKRLIEALDKAKEDARKKAEEEAKAKAEEEAKLKGEEKAKLMGGKEEKLVNENGHFSGKEDVKCNGKSASDEVKENGVVTV